MVSDNQSTQRTSLKANHLEVDSKNSTTDGTKEVSD